MQADIFEFTITDYQNVISLWKSDDGIGRSLVAKCVTALQMIGIQKCHLFTFSSNIEGIRFWERIGWIRREDLGVVSKEIDFKKLGDADR